MGRDKSHCVGDLGFGGNFGRLSEFNPIRETKMMTSADVFSRLRAKGIPISPAAFYHAISIEAVSPPTRTVSGQYLFDDIHIEQFEAYYTRARAAGRRPTALNSK